MKLPLRLLPVFLAAQVSAADANRLTHLDDPSPFWPTPSSPKLTTPQWVGEPGVDAVVVLAIDDMRGAGDPAGTAKYETFLRPILERLKQIDGRAPLSIMTCTVTPEDPQLQSWLREGLSLEVHTLTHPCPCLGKVAFDEAARVYHEGVDLLASVPGNRPVAFRMPCCDSINSVSPRFFAEIFNRRSGGGNALAIDSSVFTRPPGERFAKYFPTELRPPTKLTFENYAGFIEDYPYPYMIGGKCWEFPCMVPSDWEAFNLGGPKTPQMLEDWKAALDHVVQVKGVFTSVFHPHGWSSPEQWVEFIDYAEKAYGKRVKFLNFREALARLEKHALAGTPLRPAGDEPSAVRLLDLNGDGFMDVVAGPSTRLWEPVAQNWRDYKTPISIGATPVGPVFGVVRKTGAASVVTFGDPPGAWTFSKDGWQSEPALVSGLPASKVPLQLRDLNRDGTCELLTGKDVFSWNDQQSRWELADFKLPPGCAITDEQGRDNGLRFVDLNHDGADDVFQSNNAGYAIYLWAGMVKAHLGWNRGWPHLVARGPAASDVTAAKVLPFVKDGKNYGGWFHRGHAVWQNEDTFPLDAYVLRRSFQELIAFDLPPPKEPSQSLQSLKARPGFAVELVASEPLLQDPIAFEWDGRGRLWVVEMRDYPLGINGKGEPGGVVKVLTDSDGDGRLDRATVFAERLPFPTGVFPWRDGVIVAAAPDILFLADKDGDGRADQREVLFTGFKEGNQQHRMNGFEWGLDGWLYGANGDSGGNIVAVGKHASAGARPVSISGRDFRFRPDTGEFEAESGSAQYGRHRDDWGNWFGNNNSTWLWHYTIEDRYLRRNPKLAVKSARRLLADYPDATRVFTASDAESAPIRFNQPQSLGHVTSACSPEAYRDELFGSQFASSIFISEPVHNAVHREVLIADGATFVSRRADDEQDREFLASTDPWFRPVMAKTGPDGALYVADMYRFVLEHPEWIAPETQSRLDLRAGADRGRIYRVYPVGAKLRAVPDLAALDNQSLAMAMDHPNGWQRDTAQRLLIERGGAGAAPALKQLVSSAKNPKVRMQALATLVTMKQIDAASLQLGLRDTNPAVRVYAVRGCESLDSAKTPEALLACVDDPEITVRRQLALTLGYFRDDAASAALQRLAKRDGSREEMRIAILSSSAPDSTLFAKLNTTSAQSAAKPVVLPKPSTPDRAKVIAGYARVADLKGAPARGRELFQQQCSLCHKLKGEGKEVGPDLAMVREKPIEWLLTAILDPNAAIEERYRAQSIKLKSGAELVGIVAAETGNNLVLKLAGGVELPVLRSDVAAQQSVGRSMMPEGLETVLNAQDVADLLAWLHAN